VHSVMCLGSLELSLQYPVRLVVLPLSPLSLTSRSTPSTTVAASKAKTEDRQPLMIPFSAFPHHSYSSERAAASFRPLV